MDPSTALIGDENHPVSIYLFNVNNGNARTIYSSLTRKTLE